MKINDRVKVCDNSFCTDISYKKSYLTLESPNAVYTVTQINLKRDYRKLLMSGSLFGKKDIYISGIQDVEITNDDGSKFYIDSESLKKINVTEEIAIHESEINKREAQIAYLKAINKKNTPVSDMCFKELIDFFPYINNGVIDLYDPTCAILINLCSSSNYILMNISKDDDFGYKVLFKVKK